MIDTGTFCQIFTNDKDLIIFIDDGINKEYLVTIYKNYIVTSFSQNFNNDVIEIATLGSRMVQQIPRCPTISLDLSIIANDITISSTSVPYDIFDKYTIKDLFKVINKKIESET